MTLNAKWGRTGRNKALAELFKVISRNSHRGCEEKLKKADGLFDCFEWPVSLTTDDSSLESNISPSVTTFCHAVFVFL